MNVLVNYDFLGTVTRSGYEDSFTSILHPLQRALSSRLTVLTTTLSQNAVRPRNFCYSISLELLMC